MAGRRWTSARAADGGRRAAVGLAGRGPSGGEDHRFARGCGPGGCRPVRGVTRRWRSSVRRRQGRPGGRRERRPRTASSSSRGSSTGGTPRMREVVGHRSTSTCERWSGSSRTASPPWKRSGTSSAKRRRGHLLDGRSRTAAWRRPVWDDQGRPAGAVRGCAPRVRPTRHPIHRDLSCAGRHTGRRLVSRRRQAGCRRRRAGCALPAQHINKLLRPRTPASRRRAFQGCPDPQEQLFVNAMPRIPRRTATVGLSRLGNC
jgi:hypothetical protein